MKVIFVCTGNTCRSPMAEYLFRNMIEEQGFCEVEVTSAGVSAGRGQPAAPETSKILRERGLDSIQSHQSRSVSDIDIKEGDIILTMTRGHRERLGHLSDRAEVHTLKEFVGKTGNISDPLGRGEQAYRSLYDSLSSLLELVADRLKHRMNVK